MRMRRLIASIVIVIVIVAVIGAATKQNSSGTTSSPALVTPPATGTAATTTSAPASPAKRQTFAGDGAENIGTINVPEASTLRWSCASCGGDNFIVNNSPTDDSQITVNSINATHGVTALDAGTYHDVSVNTEGQQWTIVVVP